MSSFRNLAYFTEAVDRILGTYLAEHGFSRAQVSPTRVTYRRDGVLVSFAYYVEDLPSPWVTIDIGVVADDGSHHLAGLWRALPGDEPARGYTAWRFDDPASLDEVLQRVVTEVLAVHGPRLWESEEALHGLLAAQAQEAEMRYLEDRHRADILRARQAYDEGRFRDAIDRFVLIDSNALSAADRRRLHEARKRANRGSDEADP